MEHLDPLTSIILPYTNFAIFAVLLVIFARKPIAQALAKKRTDFEALVKESQRLKHEAEEKYRLIKQRADGLEAELARLQTDMVTQAQSESAANVQAAEKLAEHLHTEARRIATTEIDRAKKEIREELVAAALELAKSDLAQRLTPAEQSRVVSHKIAEISNIQVSGKGAHA